MSKETAMDTFMGAIMDCQVLLGKIKEHCDNHLDLSPDEINWSHAGTAQHLRTQLKEIVEHLGI